MWGIFTNLVIFPFFVFTTGHPIKKADFPARLKIQSISSICREKVAPPISEDIEFRCQEALKHIDLGPVLRMDPDWLFLNTNQHLAAEMFLLKLVFILIYKLILNSTT